MRMTISNWITIGRMVLSPLFLVLGLGSYWAAATALFVILLLSDIIDGYLARKWKETNKTGAVLDPIADKVFFITIMATLFITRDIPGWYASILMRDAAILLGTVPLWLAVKRKLVFRASSLGKAVTTLQAITVGMILTGIFVRSLPGILIESTVIATAIIGLACAIHYLYKSVASSSRHAPVV